jgi:hypothetical protein
MLPLLCSVDDVPKIVLVAANRLLSRIEYIQPSMGKMVDDTTVTCNSRQDYR